MHDKYTSDFEDTQWLHHLYMQAPVAIAIYLGKEHVIEFANPPMCEIWGRDLSQVLKKPLFNALPEVSKQGFEEIMADVFEFGKPFVGNELPATLERKDKIELAYFNILYQPLRNAQNEIIGIIQVATEVTGLVKARKKAEKNEEILKLALEGGKMGTWFKDFVEDTFTRSLGHDKIFGYKELLPVWNAKIYLSHVHPGDRALAQESYEHGLKHKHVDYEARIYGNDKSIHWIHIKGETSYNLKGQPISMSGIIMDITEQKQSAEKDRQLAAEQAARKEAERQGKTLEELFKETPALICTLIGPDHVLI